MNRRLVAAAVCASAALATGCTGLEARYHQPALPVPDAWPIAATATDGTTDGATDDIGWRDFFVDTRLQQLIALALQNNRDLRVAVLNVEKARATYQAQRSARLPSIDATGSLTRERAPPFLLGTPTAENLSYYSAGVGVSSFELDLFGRVASLSHAAWQQYVAQSEARRAAQLSLIAQVAIGYLTLAADRERARLATETLDSQQASYHLTEQQHDLGAVSGLDLSQARSTVEAARADAARFAGAVAQDADALAVLVGAEIDPSLLPEKFEPAVTGVRPLPAGLPSSVLLRRPDIREAEHMLRAADADIGAARAAFFPSITLTGNVGSVSPSVSGLFKSGTGTWTFMPQVTIPIFQGGRLRANLKSATADRDIAIAQYEKAIQSGFRDVADGLALTTTLGQVNEAQQALAAATANAYQLSEKRYRAGKDSYLTLLDAQRSDYSAQQGLITSHLAEQSNRVTLYKALGGGWQESSH